MGCCASTPTVATQTKLSHVTSISFSKISKEEKAARERRAKKREQAVRELIETEKTYVGGLNQCISNYYGGLSENTKIISNDDLKGIFNDIQTIYKLNSTFLTDLQRKFANFNNDTTRIGDQFVKFCPYFRMYQNYCNNYDNAMVLLNKYLEKQSFDTYCMEIRDKLNGKTLQSLLILPIQRLPRYKLCLSEIIKNTEKDHPDLMDLRRALELVEETTTLINERMKEFESRQQVRAIERRLSSAGSLVKPHRKFIREGVLCKVDKTGKDREYTFFLFNDMLFYASGNGDTLKMHTTLPVDRAFFIQDVPHHDKYSDRSFEIHSSVKSFIVHCTEYKIKKEWMNDLRQIIKDRILLQPGKTQERELAAPLMVPDDWSDVCQIKECNAKFTFVNRRHHCRYCGKLICGKCGKYKLVSRMDKNQFVKPVCKLCYDTYHGNNGLMFSVEEKQNESNNTDDLIKKH